MTDTPRTIEDFGVDTSAGVARQYMQRSVGSGGFFSFVRHEIYLLLFANLAGAAGFLLRRMFLRMGLPHAAPGVILGAHVTLRGTDKIRIETGTLVDDFVTFDVLDKRSSGINIGPQCSIERFSILSTGPGPHSFITLGRKVTLGPGVKLFGAGGIRIGDNVMIGHDTSMIAVQHGYERTDIPLRDQPKTVRGITIEEDVWIGAAVTVLDGVTIGRGSIIGAGSVVTRSLPPGSVAFGVPCAVVSNRLSKQ